MSEAIEYEQLEQSEGQAHAAPSQADLDRLADVPMEISVEIGRAHMTVGETLQLQVGSVVPLERQAGDAADLLVNGTAVARGEVVVIDEQYGLRITEILAAEDEDDDASTDESAEATAPDGAAAAEPAA